MKKLVTTTILIYLIFLIPGPVLAAELTSDKTSLVIGIEDVYLEIKEIRKEMNEMRKEMVTKNDLAKTEQNLQVQINDIQRRITAIWQALVGFIALLVITLISVKYFFFNIDKKELKEEIIKDEGFNQKIKEYIEDIIKQGKRLL